MDFEMDMEWPTKIHNIDLKSIWIMDFLWIFNLIRMDYGFSSILNPSGPTAHKEKFQYLTLLSLQMTHSNFDAFGPH